MNALGDIKILPHLLQSLRIRIAEEVYIIIEVWGLLWLTHTSCNIIIL